MLLTLRPQDRRLQPRHAQKIASRLGVRESIVLLPSAGGFFVEGRHEKTLAGSLGSVAATPAGLAFAPSGVRSPASVGTKYSGLGYDAYPFTLLLVVQPTVSSATASTIVQFVRASDGAPGASVQSGDGTNRRWQFSSYFGGTNKTTTATDWEVGRPTTVLITGNCYANVSFDLRIYVDGVKSADNAAGYQWVDYNGLNAMYLDAGSASVRFMLAAAWLQQTSDGLARKLSARPWSLFTPVRRPVFFGAGAGTTVSVPVGAISVAGYAPTVTATAHQTISVPAGSVTLNGYAPTVSTSASQTIAVPAGAVTLAGYAPTVTATANQSIAVPVGAVSLAGYAPSVFTTAVTTISVPAGAVSLAGFAPTISYTTHAYIDVPKGAVTLTGYAPTVTGGESSIWTPVTTDSAVWSAQNVSAATWTPQ